MAGAGQLGLIMCKYARGRPAGDWCLSLAPICKHSNYPPRLISILPGMRSAGVQWRYACKTMTVALSLLASYSGHVTMQWPPGPEMAAQGWPVTRGSHSSYPRCRAHSSTQVGHQLRELMFSGIFTLEYVRGETHKNICHPLLAWSETTNNQELKKC